MYCLSNQNKYILVPLCEVANFLMVFPLKTTQTADVCTAIMDGYIKYFGFPSHVISNQYLALTQCFYQQFGIMISKSTLIEVGIRSLSNTLMNHLFGLGCD